MEQNAFANHIRILSNRVEHIRSCVFIAYQHTVLAECDVVTAILSVCHDKV